MGHVEDAHPPASLGLASAGELHKGRDGNGSVFDVTVDIVR